MRIILNVLWIDCTAGALVGVLVLSFSGWLSRLYSMPVGFLYFMGVVNLLYAAYSFSFAIRRTRPRTLISPIGRRERGLVFGVSGYGSAFL
jgi:hypothetical protein